MFRIISIVIALGLFLSSWFIYHKLIVETIKHRLIMALLVLGFGCLLNISGSNLMGDCGLVMIVIGMYLLIVSVIKLQNRNQDQNILYQQRQYQHSQH